VTVVNGLGRQYAARVPREVGLGIARVEVGGVKMETEVRSSSPGLFFTNTEGLEQFGTGMRYRPDVEGFAGGLAVKAEVEGVERVRFVLPDGVKLRGAVPVWVRIGECKSNRLLVRLR